MTKSALQHGSNRLDSLIQEKTSHLRFIKKNNNKPLDTHRKGKRYLSLTKKSNNNS